MAVLPVVVIIVIFDLWRFSNVEMHVLDIAPHKHQNNVETLSLALKLAKLDVFIYYKNGECHQQSASAVDSLLEYGASNSASKHFLPPNCKQTWHCSFGMLLDIPQLDILKSVEQTQIETSFLPTK